ncbi:snRNA-activating protein complex subunit 4, partial [Caerostris extrusa]
SKGWLQFEKEKLVDGVMANALSYVVKPYKIKRDHLRDKLKNDKNIEEFEMHQIRKQIKKIQKEIRKQSQRSPLDIYQEAEEHIDWLEVSATHMEGSKSYLECEIMWKNCMSISVNKKRPTKEEDARLVDLVQKHNGENWDLIAEELQTGRTAVQCFERYQRHLNEHLRKSKSKSDFLNSNIEHNRNYSDLYWTPEEDEELIKVVETFRVGNFIPWNQVCCPN